ncbi:hypothetical protein Egran_04423 [Elaphomyces granulatus]|uniref:Coatomer subunit epsilon n=1 Tax=Elaphomyces granulatus TaxID=519963 RepID=A0A232LUI3_9EURO|nr:hypothetical protein Egran_04423 [Elaphomyces granulatus]
MDRFLTDGELVTLQTAFHKQQYEDVIDFDASGLSPENKLATRVFQLRSKIVLEQSEEVLAEIEGEDTPDLVAVQVLCGKVLYAEGQSEEALALLMKHQGNLEALALIIQIHTQEVVAAKQWAQDSLVLNLAESWVRMKSKMRSAFYVYEELASDPTASSTVSIVGHAVAELHRSRLLEAEAAFSAALKKYPGVEQLIANQADPIVTLRYNLSTAYCAGIGRTMLGECHCAGPV